MNLDPPQSGSGPWNQLSHSFADVIIQTGSVAGNITINGASRAAPARIVSRVRHFVSRAGTTGLGELRPKDSAFAVVTGPPGIGKTSLVIQWIGRNASRFGGSQLYVNLNGYGSRAALTAKDLSRLVLLQLGVPISAVPGDEQALTALCRSRLSEGQHLLFLDNANSEVQVRDLLDPFPPCTIVITSRDSLEPLIAKGGIRVIVPPFTRDESIKYIRKRLGPEWLDPDSAAGREILRLCAGVPLALSIMVARTELDRLSANDVSRELQSAGGVLEFLDFGDSHHGLATVYSWSLDRLSDEARRAFALMGLLDSGTVTQQVVRAGLKVDQATARNTLSELRRASLLEPLTPRAFVAHDLTLEVARATISDVLSKDDQVGVWQSTLDYLAGATYGCDRLLYPHRTDIPMDPIGSRWAEAQDYRAAFHWFDESATIALAAIDSPTAISTSPASVWQMCWSLTTYLDRTGRWDDYLRSQAVAVRVAAGLGDPMLLGLSERLLATAQSRLGQYSAARGALESSLNHTTERREVARTTLAIAFVDGMERRYLDALRRSAEAYDLYSEIEDELGSARALSFVVAFRAMIEPDNESAIVDIAWAIESLERFGSVWEAGHAYYHQGLVFGGTRRREDALRSFATSAEIFGSMEDHFLEARARLAMGDIAYAMPDGMLAAREHWMSAERLLRPFGDLFTDIPRRRTAGESPELVGPLPSPHPVA